MLNPHVNVTSIYFHVLPWKNNKNQNTANRRTKWAMFHNYVSLLEDEPHWWCMIFHWRITVMYNYFHQFGFPQQIRNNGRTERCGQICKATKTPNPQDERDRFFCHVSPTALALRSIVTFYGACIEESRSIVLIVEDSYTPKILKHVKKNQDFCLGWVKTSWCRNPSDS